MQSAYNGSFGLPGDPMRIDAQRLLAALLAPGSAAQRRSLLRVIAGVLCSVGVAFAQAQVVIGAFEFPPIYQNAAHKGLSGDLALAALKAAGREAQLRFYPAARMVKAVADGEVACALGGRVLFEAPEIADRVRVSTVIQYVSQVFFFDIRRHPDGVKYSATNDLAGYRIGVLESSGIMRILSNQGPLRLAPATSHEGLARQLALGRIDLWATVDLTGLAQLRALFPDESRYYRYTRPFNLGDVSFVCSKKRDPDNALGRLFEKGMKKIVEDGTYLEIMARYYGEPAAINRDSLNDEQLQRLR
jgi:ABC-type amino acid transport substrate-binding protein